MVQKADKFIKFEIEIAQLPMKAMFGGVSKDKESSITEDDSDYKEATWEDIDAFAKMLGGGM